MPSTSKDSLLSIARALLGILIGLMIAAMALVAIGVAALLTVQREELVNRVAEAGLDPMTYWGVLVGLVGYVLVLGCALRFAMELYRVVVSVGEGDPFVTENAERLRRMGWLALAIQAVGIPLEVAASHLASLDEAVVVELGASGGGFALALVLFILARVFRTGTEMRAELEGTV